jgi:hypothetical protein
LRQESKVYVRERERFVGGGRSKCQGHARHYRYRIRYYVGFIDHSIPACVRSIAGARLGERIGTMRRLGWTAWCIALFLTPTLVLALASGATAQWIPLNPVASVQKQADGVDFIMHSGTLRIQLWGAEVRAQRAQRKPEARSGA